MMSLVTEKREIKILSERDWESGKAKLKLLNKERREELLTIIFDFFDEQPSVFVIKEDVFQRRKKARLLAPELTPRLRQLIATLEVMQNPDLMQSIENSREKPDNRYRKYEEVAKELGLT